MTTFGFSVRKCFPFCSDEKLDDSQVANLGKAFNSSQQRKVRACVGYTVVPPGLELCFSYLLNDKYVFVRGFFHLQ